jgi:hypothetical protein
MNWRTFRFSSREALSVVCCFLITLSFSVCSEGGGRSSASQHPQSSSGNHPADRTPPGPVTTPLAKVIYSKESNSVSYINVVNEDGSARYVLATNARCGVVTSDGRVVYWNPIDRTIYRVNLDGSDLVALVSDVSDPGGIYLYPSYRPINVTSNGWVVYEQASQSAGIPKYTSDLYSVPLDGSSGAVILANSPGYDRFQGESRDGRVIYGISPSDVSGGSYSINSVNPDGTDARLLIEDPALPLTYLVTSPEGRLLYRAGNGSSESRLFQANEDGSDARPLISSATGENYFLDLVGEQVIYSPCTSGPPLCKYGDRDGIGMVNANGSDNRLLIPGDFIDFGGILNGTRVVYAVTYGTDQGVYSIRFDGTDISQMTNSGNHPFVTVTGQIVFREGYYPTGQLWAIDPTAGNALLLDDLLGSQYAVGSTRNGRVIYFGILPGGPYYSLYSNAIDGTASTLLEQELGTSINALTGNVLAIYESQSDCKWPNVPETWPFQPGHRHQAAGLRPRQAPGAGCRARWKGGFPGHRHATENGTAGEVRVDRPDPGGSRGLYR